jgi:DNA-binding LytR/AlgR family response regulator
VAAAAGVFLALVGAFGSDERSLGSRLVYWVGLMLAGGVWGGACAGLVFGRGWLDGRLWLQGALLTVIIAVPFTLVVWWATSAFYGFPLRVERLPAFLVNVTVVAAAMTAVNMAVERSPAQTGVAAPDAAPPKFLARLPLRLRGADLYAVQAEDHYLRVHTDRGSDLILMRLSDAVAELEGLEGARTHRSWWVARHAVVDVERGDGRATLTLRDGARVPVSRSYARVLRAAGWW